MFLLAQYHGVKTNISDWDTSRYDIVWHHHCRANATIIIINIINIQTMTWFFFSSLSTLSPPNLQTWHHGVAHQTTSDHLAKLVKGCKFRWEKSWFFFLFSKNFQFECRQMICLGKRWRSSSVRRERGTRPTPPSSPWGAWSPPSSSCSSSTRTRLSPTETSPRRTWYMTQYNDSHAAMTPLWPPW